MDKLRVAVIMGGVSSEHDVSLRSGAKVVEALDPGRFDVIRITIGRDGSWRCAGRNLTTVDGLRFLKEQCVDCAFLALHGPFGEDGRIQGALDLIGVSYTGSGCGASAIAMDKVRTKALAQHAGVKVARQLIIRCQEWNTDADAWITRIHQNLGFPCVVKDPCQGSSLHMAIPGDGASLRNSCNAIFEVTSWIMVEEYLKGRELTCGVLDIDPAEPAIALPVTEICPVTAAFFDYEAKYTPGATREITPAEIPSETAHKTQDIALRVHEAVGCRGLSRSDMILVDGEPIFIEINTIPGMTETSLFPQAAAVHGLSFADVVRLLVQRAVAGRTQSVTA